MQDVDWDSFFLFNRISFILFLTAQEMVNKVV